MNIATTPADAATTADTAKASVKPASVGNPATAVAASSVADTCEPSDDPTERTRALNPVASPVCAAGTASRTRFGIAANANPIPLDITTQNRVTTSGLPCSTA